MSGNKEAQAARNAADRRLREMFPGEFAGLMVEEHGKRGLTWNRRSTADERARREAEEKEARALARIAKIAKENGLTAEATNRVLIAVQDESETIAEKAARIGDEAEANERKTVVDSGSYADDIVNQHSAPVGGW